MKSLKFDHDIARRVERGEIRSTWRFQDDKDLAVNDQIRLIDKVDPSRPETWRVAGEARIERIIEKRLEDVRRSDLKDYHFASEEEMITTILGTNHSLVNATTVVKLLYYTSPGASITGSDVKNTKPVKPTVRKVQLYTDGGSRGNPGPSAAGYVVLDASGEAVLTDRGVYVGITTNNQAEYLALKYGLEEARGMGAREVSCYLDSMLVVNQMNGIFKVSNRDLWPVHEAIKQLAAAFEKVSFTHVPREKNRLADAAVNRALDEGMAEAAGDSG